MIWTPGKDLVQLIGCNDGYVKQSGDSVVGGGVQLPHRGLGTPHRLPDECWRRGLDLTACPGRLKLGSTRHVNCAGCRLPAAGAAPTAPTAPTASTASTLPIDITNQINVVHRQALPGNSSRDFPDMGIKRASML